MKETTSPVAQMVQLLLDRGTLFVGYLVLAPLCCICSILFALSLEPILRAGMALDGGSLGRAALGALGLAVLDMVLALLLRRVRLLLLQCCTDALRCRLMDGLLSGTPAQFRRWDAAGYLTLFGNHIDRIKDNCLSSLLSLYENGWNLLLSMAVLVWYSPWLGVFLLAIGFASIRIPGLFSGRLEKKQENQMQQAERHLVLLRDILGGYWVIKNHCVERQFRKKYGEASGRRAQADFQGEFAPYAVSWLSFSVTSLSFIGIISISAWLVVRGQLAASLVLSLSQLIGGVLVPLEAIPQHAAQLKGAKRVWEELTPHWSETPAREDAPPLPTDWKTVSLEHLHFRYGEDRPLVLDDASLVLERGKKYVLMGRSGSGKSTLAKLLAGIQSAPCSLAVDGAVTDLSALTARVSYLDQNVFLFHDSIYENISLFRDLDPVEVKKQLDRMQLGGHLSKTGDILSLSVGEDGAQLSGGERQRIALARDLLGKKDILVLDESLSALDPATVRELEQLILGLSGVTCLLITHHPDSLLLERCDGVLSLEDGKIVAVKSFSKIDS